MNIFLLCAVEDILKRRSGASNPIQGQLPVLEKVDPMVARSIELRMQRGEKESTLYEVIIGHIKQLNNPGFYRKNGELKESAFYKYAYIDKSTWSELRWNLITPKKKTLLKLVIALHLNEEAAIDLMHRGASSFDPKDLRDQIILALIELKCYNPDDVYDVLEEYRLHGTQKFENIYEMKERKAKEKKLESSV